MHRSRKGVGRLLNRVPVLGRGATGFFTGAGADAMATRRGPCVHESQSGVDHRIPHRTIRGIEGSKGRRPGGALPLGEGIRQKARRRTPRAVWAVIGRRLRRPRGQRRRQQRLKMHKGPEYMHALVLAASPATRASPAPPRTTGQGASAIQRFFLVLCVLCGLAAVGHLEAIRLEAICERLGFMCALSLSLAAAAPRAFVCVCVSVCFGGARSSI
jgi:hypothetical protein